MCPLSAANRRKAGKKNNLERRGKEGEGKEEKRNPTNLIPKVDSK